MMIVECNSMNAMVQSRAQCGYGTSQFPVNAGRAWSVSCKDSLLVNSSDIYQEPKEIKKTSKTMKVLKKFKRRIGLAPRSGLNPNLAPLRFHSVHGEHVQLFNEGSTARRVESFCRGICFSDRPVRLGEKITIRVAEASTSWSGVLRIGVSATDPTTLQGALPKYACPDLTNKPGYWAKAIHERHSDQGTILSYYFSAAGDMHYSVNGEDKGILLSGIDTRHPLWALIDVYGNSTGVDFVESRLHATTSNNQPTSARHPRPVSVISPVLARPSGNIPRAGSETDLDRIILPSMNQLTLSSPGTSQSHVQSPVSQKLQQMPFHRTRGRHVRLGSDACLAWRVEGEFCQGYVFTAKPIRTGERVVVLVQGTEQLYVGAMAFGLTACDPSRLTPDMLPDDSDSLLDRPEYWVVAKDVAGLPRRGDELAFTITPSGAVHLSKNGGSPTTIMHVDNSLTLWAFFDIYGNTQCLRSIGVAPVQPPACPLPNPPAVIPSPSSDYGIVRRQQLASEVQSKVNPPVVLSGGIYGEIPPRGVTYGEPSSLHGHSHIETLAPSSSHGPSSLPNPEYTSGSECTVCFERNIDAVLYSCGHMCMCYVCAIHLWRNRPGSQCPMCRAPIRDVIRTYKS